MTRRYGWQGKQTIRSNNMKITKVVVYDQDGTELVTHSFAPIILSPGQTVSFTYLYERTSGQLIPQAKP